MRNIKINNLTETVKNNKDMKYIIYRECDGECWYYGCTRDENKAFEVAMDINGCIATRDYIGLK